jgi:hypothetical protein
MSEYHWKTVSVVAFDELMQALDRADRKGYMPDAIKEEWEAFNWKLEQPAQQEPVAWGIIASNTGRICQVELDADEVEGHNPKHIVPLYTFPPAQRKPLDAGEISRLWKQHTSEDGPHHNPYDDDGLGFARAIEAAHGIKGEA